ncbi:MAG: hypothetical protein Q9201_000435 [Fulgogasparrea decipioides]
MALSVFDLVAKLPAAALPGFVVALLYYFILQIITYRTRSKFRLEHGCKPPSKYPVRDPIFGLDVIYDSIRAVKRRTFLSDKLAHYDAYGYTHSSRLTTMPVIVTIEPENIKAVLLTNFKDFVVGTPRRRAFSPVLANSILIADGAEWEHSRAFLRPSFARSQVGDLATLEFHVKNLLDLLPRDGSTVDLAEIFFRFTADVTTDFMFGESILSLPQPEAFGGELAAAARDAQLGAERRFRLGIFAHIVPQPAFYRSVRKLHAYMDAHVDKAVQQRRSQNTSGKTDEHDKDRYIFSKELAKLTDDRIQLRDQLAGIFFAGRDTTAALLSNFFFVLSREPQAWKRLQREIDSLDGRKPTLDELKGLKYLSFCLNETLRLYPIVQGTSRVAINDVILPTGGGDDGKSPILVTKGSLVMFHMFALHKRKDIWGDDADDFRPERWQDEKTSWDVSILPFPFSRYRMNDFYLLQSNSRLQKPPTRQSDSYKSSQASRVGIRGRGPNA